VYGYPYRAQRRIFRRFSPSFLSFSPLLSTYAGTAFYETKILTVFNSDSLLLTQPPLPPRMSKCVSRECSIRYPRSTLVHRLNRKKHLLCMVRPQTVDIYNKLVEPCPNHEDVFQNSNIGYPRVEPGGFISICPGPSFPSFFLPPF
jgi:hypothetical protein